MIKKSRILKKLLLAIIIAPIFCFSGLLLFASITDFSPDEGSVDPVLPTFLANKKIIPDTLCILIWNIGYSGLGKEADFFMDGGSHVKVSQTLSEKYFHSICAFLENEKSETDFILLQEIDRASSRSYLNDQFNKIRDVLNGFEATFALNYDVKFVPVPFKIPYEPYGKTLSGLASFSKYRSAGSFRVQYPGGFGWPEKLFMLDRCGLEQKFKLKNGRELIIVNTHNSAYDETGEIKLKEMKFIRERYEMYAKNGASVIIGGDWNQTPPGFSATHFNANISEGYSRNPMDSTMIPIGFNVVSDNSLSTNRSLKDPYTKGRNYETLIDYFLISKNIEIISVKTINLGFAESDHQPVLLNCIIRD